MRHSPDDEKKSVDIQNETGYSLVMFLEKEGIAGDDFSV
jgi:hypothetical protein